MDTGSSDDSVFTIDSPMIWSPSPKEKRRYWLEINVSVQQQQLHAEWTYSDQLHKATTIENLANNFIQALRDLIAYCHSSHRREHTPSDFPLASLSEQDFAAISDQLTNLNVGEEDPTNAFSHVEDMYRQTPVQEGMLFHTLKEPGSGVYVEQYCCTIRGDFNTKVFKKAWEKVGNRHPILRTGFFWEGLSHGIQVVHKKANFVWSEEDLRRLPDSQQRRSLEIFLLRDRRGRIYDRSPFLTSFSFISDFR